MKQSGAPRVQKCTYTMQTKMYLCKMYPRVQKKTVLGALLATQWQPSAHFSACMFET